MESQRGLTEVGIKRSRELVSSGSLSDIIDRESNGLTKMSSPLSKRTSSSSSSSASSSLSARSRTTSSTVEHDVGDDLIERESMQKNPKNQKIGGDRDGNSRSSSSSPRNSRDNGNDNGSNGNGIIPTSPAADTAAGTAAGGTGGGAGGGIKTSSSMDAFGVDEELYPMFINEAGNSFARLIDRSSHSL